MLILGIDPGPEQSGWAIYDTVKDALIGSDVSSNKELEALLRLILGFDRCVIEMVANYGVNAGSHVFDTCVAIGRFEEVVESTCGIKADKINRPNVSYHFTKKRNSSKAKIRKAIWSRYGKTINEAKGTKQKPGPLFGIKDHAWDALAVAMAFAEKSGTTICMTGDK